MYISHSWLKKYLPELDKLQPETVAGALTGTLAEVEKFWTVRGALDKIVCGEVLEVKPLEGTSKLNQCLVDIGPAKNVIICGAPNVAAGQKVAVCLPGGRVYDAHSKNPEDTIEIKEKALMGVTSHGMICSPKELNLTDDHEGIMVLEPELKVGTDLIPVLKDIVYEIENKSLSHRPDCFSHIGIARELSAILNLEFVDNNPEPILAYTKQIPFTLDVKADEKLCPRFSTVLMTEIEIKASPLWLISKLTAVDVRPVNNVVDITNYVMMDKGQPLHAYDYGKLEGNKLVVRSAKDGEKFTAINAKKYDLNKENLVVCDGNGVQDLAGIMGGAASEVSESTKTIVLEAANFNMYNIRRTSRQLGLRSEASTRFEKGQDPNNTIIGLKTAVELILDITNSEIASDLTDHYPTKREQKTIQFNTLSVKRFLGIDMPRQEIIDVFKRLKLEVIEKEKSQDELEVVIPTYRGDLNMEADLLEEVARLYGYSKIQPSLPTKSLEAVKSNAFDMMVRKINQTLVKQGMDEILTYSFVDPALYQSLGLSAKEALEISNPLSPELSLIRNTLIPSLISTAKNNAKKHDSFSIFEINRAIQKGLDSNGIHIQPMHLGILTYNTKSGNLFEVIKGNLETLFAELSIEFKLTPIDFKSQFLAPTMHKHRVANITVGNETIGLVSELKPSTANAINLNGRVAFAEINLEKVFSFYKKDKTYTRVSVYPSVLRDLSFWLDTKISYQSVIDVVKACKIDSLKTISLIDQFSSPDKPNTKSIAIRIELQDANKTLSEVEIEPIFATITSALAKELKCVIRDSK